jgi:hypothetical protein
LPPLEAENHGAGDILIAMSPVPADSISSGKWHFPGECQIT